MPQGIVRRPSEEARRDFTPIIDPGRKMNEKEKFEEEIAKQMQLAHSKGLPFAEKVARDDFNDHYEKQAKLSMRKRGYVNAADIKPVQMDWEKYSDIKNWELVNEGERYDEHLSKRLNLEVYFKYKKYKFKGYNFTDTVMEDKGQAVARAKKEK